MVEILKALRRIQPKKIAVIGDFVLDSYVLGQVSRISPEAPVPVLHVKEVKDIPGMAGNVALNLSALGSDVYVIGRLGHDASGLQFIEYLQSESIDVQGIVFQKGYPTPVKQRIIAQSQQLLRVDREETFPPTQEVENLLIEQIQKICSSVDVIALSDYKKGMLTSKILSAIFNMGKKFKIPVIVDPKGDDFTKYSGCTWIKPNLSEAYIAAKKTKEVSLDAVAQNLLKETQATHLLITKSEEGMSLFSMDGYREDFLVKSHEVKDVTGAGDTVLSMLAMCVANALTPSQSIELSNIAASIVIQKLGCSKVTLSEIAHVILSKNQDSKIFDQENAFALYEILKQNPFCLLVIDIQQKMTPELFIALQKLSKKHTKVPLIVYLESHPLSETLISALSSFEEVSFVLVHPGHASQIEHLAPLKGYYFKENHLLDVIDPKELLKELLVNHVR